MSKTISDQDFKLLQEMAEDMATENMGSLCEKGKKCMQILKVADPEIEFLHKDAVVYSIPGISLDQEVVDKRLSFEELRKFLSGKKICIVDENDYVLAESCVDYIQY